MLHLSKVADEADPLFTIIVFDKYRYVNQPVCDD